MKKILVLLVVMALATSAKDGFKELTNQTFTNMELDLNSLMQP